MNRSFATEVWRAVKYLLITGAVNAAFALVSGAATTQILSADTAQAGQWLSVLSYAYTVFAVSIATLLNRCFTFRATEKWYIALPIMLLAKLAWNLLTGLMLIQVARSGTEVVSMTSELLGLLWILAAYPLQRCVIYCHTTDTNGWYARFRLGDDEREENADE